MCHSEECPPFLFLRSCVIPGAFGCKIQVPGEPRDGSQGRLRSDIGMRGREEEGMTQSRSKTASTGDISGVHTQAQESSVIPSALKGQVGSPPPALLQSLAPCAYRYIGGCSSTSHLNILPVGAQGSAHVLTPLSLDAGVSSL